MAASRLVRVREEEMEQPPDRAIDEHPGQRQQGAILLEKAYVEAPAGAAAVLDPGILDSWISRS